IIQAVDVHIHHNRVRILDKAGLGFAIQILAEDSVIERNDLRVVPAGSTEPPGNPEGNPDPADPCAELEVLYGVPGLSLFADYIFGVAILAFPVVPFIALGGIQIAAGSERIKVLENIILGGAGNGILLGGIIAVSSGPILLEAVPEQTI